MLFRIPGRLSRAVGNSKPFAGFIVSGCRYGGSPFYNATPGLTCKGYLSGT